MPHTSRKKGPPNHPRKRQLVDVGNGWTAIVSSLSGARAPTRSSPLTPTSFEPAAIPPGLTVERLCDEYDRYKKTWEESACCAEVVEALKEKLSGRHGRVEECVCLGLGSVADGRSRRVGMLQLAVLETVVRILGRACGRSPNTANALRYGYILLACNQIK